MAGVPSDMAIEHGAISIEGAQANVGMVELPKLTHKGGFSAMMSPRVAKSR